MVEQRRTHKRVQRLWRSHRTYKEPNSLLKTAKMPLRASLHRKPTSGRWSSRHSKRREVLSVNMISLPLADFRHISHIGNDAHRDSFGDLSFLKMGHSLLLQSSQSEQNLFLACSPPPKPPRLNMEPEGSKSTDWPVDHQENASQKRKKCSSMPLLDSEEGETVLVDRYERENNVATHQFSSAGWDNMSADSNRDYSVVGDKSEGQQKEEDNGFSFSLDLGPSILDDVLQVMDKLQH
ncbi:cdc42 effector protein 3-like [Phyllopteryx taeniolatus]|uniref:cdc42 effector protein 3-like n=1 Tax=Phyllopteryx taeniolatus TaxID=161469 RepID=UPI002AD4D23E|nr:cdc42 effector protein 3-like [Phyllopteryx taeniolatus]XP_061651109.1 cdc42 effector protein 3-like [Phyllopteryx taeniolatus]XP_061651110.1 cdc42 effector protein 3-like [Phyllopteryx taeniolatus]